MCFIVIPLFYTGSQFAFDPLYASAVSGAGAPQRVLLRHGRSSSAAAAEAAAAPSECGQAGPGTLSWPSSLAVAVVWQLAWR